MDNLLLACSRSHNLRAPDIEPATTISSALPNRTASTGLVWPDKLYIKISIKSITHHNETCWHLTSTELVAYGKHHHIPSILLFIEGVSFSEAKLVLRTWWNTMLSLHHYIIIVRHSIRCWSWSYEQESYQLCNINYWSCSLSNSWME